MESLRLTSLRVVIASVIMSAKTRQHIVQSRIKPHRQLQLISATRDIATRLKRDVVVGNWKLTLKAAMAGSGGGLGLGCSRLWRHRGVVGRCIERIQKTDESIDDSNLQSRNRIGWWLAKRRKYGVVGKEEKGGSAAAGAASVYSSEESAQ